MRRNARSRQFESQRGQAMIDDEGCSKLNSKRVGKGRPPHSSRWKKGQSGNPKGRPKGSKNLATLYSELLDGKVTIREGGAVFKVTRREALVRVQIQKGVKGDITAIQQIFAQDKRVQRARRSLPTITSDMSVHESARIYAQLMQGEEDDDEDP